MAIRIDRAVAFLTDEEQRVVGYVDNCGRERTMTGEPIEPGTTPNSDFAGTAAQVKVDELKTDLADPSKGAAMVAYDPDAEYAEGSIGKAIETAGNADAKINTHDHDPAAHPELSSFISGEADRAGVAAAQAEAARDAAMVGAQLYADEATGRAAVADGEYFKVVSANPNVAAELYQRSSASISTLVTSYPSNLAYDAVQASVGDISFDLTDADLTITQRYIDKTTGNEAGGSAYNCSDFLEVMPDTQYLVHAKTVGNAAHAWYDENKIFISSFGIDNNNTEHSVTAPSTARYARFTSYQSSPYYFACRALVNDYNLKRLKQVMAIHMPGVDAQKVMVDGVTLNAALTTIENEQAALETSQQQLTDLLALMATDGGIRKIFKNRVASIGDSTMRGTYGGDGEEGVDGASVPVAGDSWLSHMCFFSNQQITRVANCGDIGDTVQGMRDRFASDIIARAPDTVFISGGTNNAVLDPATTPQEYKEIMIEMVEAAIAAGITPVMTSVLPSSNSPKYLMNSQYNLKQQEICEQYNLFYLDLYSFALDPDTGGLKAEYSGDGVHPSAAGQQALGQYAASVVLPRILGSAPPVATTNDDSKNLVVNPLFLGAPGANGNAPSWAVSGGVPSGATFSVVPSPDGIGNMQRIQAEGSSAGAVLIQTITTDRWSPGELVEITGKYVAEGNTSNLSFWMSFSGGRQTKPLSTSLSSSGTFYLRYRIKPDATNMTLQMRVGAGSGALQIGRILLRNLTREGLDT